jgi:hypothetical protein
VAQAPNWPLIVWAAATAGLWLARPHGWPRDASRVIAAVALALWASDEVLRGVNPFRRMLGGAVLGWLGFSLVRLS